jgi:1-acyl-sn-glycerol-3-phosphate acyltransferase
MIVNSCLEKNHTEGQTMFKTLLLRFIFRPFAKIILRLTGWKAVPMTKDIKKAVAILAPHTSTWDFLIGLNIVIASESPLKWVGKKELFRRPFGGILQSFGGVPLDRESAKGTVGRVAKLFETKDEFLYGISPEGTRNKTTYWRSGFYHLALQAKVPIVYYFIDYKTKTGGYGGHFMPTGDEKQDLNTIKIFFDTITPKCPKKYSPVCFKQ